MEWRQLGRTGVQVSVLGLGTMNFGNKTPTDEAIRMIDYAMDCGINLIDTANVYGRGAAEEAVGKALTANGRRDRIILASKAHFRMDDLDPNAQGNSRRHLMSACEASLKRLRTDYLDLYQIHRPSSVVPIDETLRAMDDLIKQGKVRYSGTSAFPSWRIMESLWVSKELGLNRFISEQAPYHLMDRRAERELLPMLQSYGMGCLVFSPLAGGFLTGKYQDVSDRPEDARYNVAGQEWADRYFSAASFKLIELLRKISLAKVKTITQISLAWVISKPGVTSALIGPRTMEQMEECLKSTEVMLTDQDHEIFDKVTPTGRFIADCYRPSTDLNMHGWV